MTDSERLAEATALLERLANGYGDNPEGDDLVSDVRDFLSRARAPAQPAAPEPSAPHNYVHKAFFEQWVGVYKQRAESAEAKLAAVPTLVERIEADLKCMPMLMKPEDLRWFFDRVRDLIRAERGGGK